MSTVESVRINSFHSDICARLIKTNEQNNHDFYYFRCSVNASRLFRFKAFLGSFQIFHNFFHRLRIHCGLVLSILGGFQIGSPGNNFHSTLHFEPWRRSTFYYLFFDRQRRRSGLVKTALCRQTLCDRSGWCYQQCIWCACNLCA